MGTERAGEADTFPKLLLAHAREARGDKGSCRDYVVSTHAHLVSLGVRMPFAANLLSKFFGRMRLPVKLCGPISRNGHHPCSER